MGLEVRVKPSVNPFNGPKPRIIGATIYKINPGYCGRPGGPNGPDEIVTEVVYAYSGVVKTADGNVYSNGEFRIRHYAEEAN
jgi:hypothetical protein